MTPDSKEWSFEYQKENGPRMVRLMQIWSLMWAFVPELNANDDIGLGIEHFCKGEFINHRHPLKDYASLQEETLIFHSFTDRHHRPFAGDVH